MSQGNLTYNYIEKIHKVLSVEENKDWILCGSAGLALINNTTNPVHDLDFIISQNNFLEYLKNNKRDTLLNKNPCNRFIIEQAPYTHFKISNSLENYGIDICLFVAYFSIEIIDINGIKVQNKDQIEIFKRGMENWTSGWRNGKKMAESVMNLF